MTLSQKNYAYPQSQSEGCPGNACEIRPAHSQTGVAIPLPPQYSTADRYGLGYRPDMPFPEAAEVYIHSRSFATKSGRRGAAHYISPKTLYEYKRYITSLNLFFGKMRLCDIRLDHLRKYQMARVNGDEPFVRYRRPQDALPRRVRTARGEYNILPPIGKQPCPTKPQHVNQELCLVKAMMKRAQLWDQVFVDFYEELQAPPDEMPRALSREEQRKWLEVSASRERWHVVYWYSILAFASCMSTNEIRALRLSDIDLQNRVLIVPPEGAKNVYRRRTIPLEQDHVVWAMENLIDRARRLGSSEPFHYLFPFAERRTKTNASSGVQHPRGLRVFDPTRPMTVDGLKHLWNEVRQATGLMRFRMYDTRHSAITRLAETGTPMSIVMSMAGHISPRMTQHYTHISEQKKIEAMRKAARMMSAGLDRADSLPEGEEALVLMPATMSRPQAVGLESDKQVDRTVVRASVSRPRVPARLPSTLVVPAQPSWQQSSTFLMGSFRDNR